MIGARSPELKIPIMQYDEAEIAIDPLRHSVSHLPAHNRDTATEVGHFTIDCFIREGLIEIHPK